MRVRTVTGDVDPSTLGVVYAHEHLILDNALIAGEFPHIHLPSVEEAVAEVTECADVGVGAMVDAMPAAGGRHVERLAEVSRRTGVAVLAMTGLHTPKYYRHHPWALEADPGTLADLFAEDIEEGIDRYDYTGPVVDRTDHRAGVIKVATDADGMTPRARRVFAGAVEASRRTGAPLLTHCEEGLGALAQIEELSALGHDLDRVVISHMDKVTDLSYHRDVLASGANVEYDQALRRPAGPENDTARIVAAMAGEGYLDRIMFGTDGARRTLWRTLGGAPGLAWLRTGFLEALAGHGIDDAARELMFTDNPQRFFTLREAA